MRTRRRPACRRRNVIVTLALAAACALTVSTDDAQAADSVQDIPPIDHQRWSWNRFSFSAGVAVITANTIDELWSGTYARARGDAGGLLYLLGGSYELKAMRLSLFGREYYPTWSALAVVGLVNENGRDPFGTYNVGLTLRWRDFPWNRFLATSVSTGLGLSYTDRIIMIERVRHPRRERSHLKFYWPMELALALPSHRGHELLLFIHHQSGGNIFDVGGSNHVGLGYRFTPR